MTVIIENPLLRLYLGNALAVLKTIASNSIDCCVTSPPYWGLRDYGHVDQIGLEPSPFEYIEKLTNVFEEVRRVLKPSGTCWLVIGDSYAGGGKGDYGPMRKQTTNPGSFNGNLVTHWRGSGAIKPKDLCGIPWRLAFALQERGWYLRQDIIWAKSNPMPESVTDRCTRSHEHVFMLSKRAKYYYDAEAISTPHLDTVGSNRGGTLGARNGNDPLISSKNHKGPASLAKQMANRRDVWSISSELYPEAHFATFPTRLVELCIKAGVPVDGVVLDPFAGSGTTGEVALKLGRKAVMIDINPEYIEMIKRNVGLFAVAT